VRCNCKPGGDADAGGVNKLMLAKPLRFVALLCALAAEWGKKLGLVRLAAAVLPCAGLIHLSSLTNSAGLAPDLQDWLRGCFGHDAKH
jgi:hypothetical protein